MKTIDVIGVPLKYGCYVNGADLAYDSIKDNIEKVLNIKCNNRIDNDCTNIEVIHDDKIKYISETMIINNRLYHSALKTFKSNKTPLIIGGDHSLAIGSISAAQDYYKGDVSVIYVDKHADIHNEKTSPSGNIHGMPLSICIGRCDKRFDIGKYRLKPKNLYFLGLCNYEQEEINYIKEENIFYLKDNEININNVDSIINKLKTLIKTNHVHLSFDWDSIRDADFHAVNVSCENKYQDKNGISYETAKELVKKILDSFNICSMDMVEYNPLLDKNGMCKKKIEEVLRIIRDHL